MTDDDDAPDRLPAELIAGITEERITKIARGQEACEDKRLLRACRLFEILNLRAKGEEYRQIAPQLGISPSWACEMVQKFMKAKASDSADTLRELNTERLTTAINKLQDKIDKGSVPAIMALDKLIKSINEMHGVEPAQRIDLNNNVRVTRRIIDPQDPQDPIESGNAGDS